jgi:hypothetical protein
VQFIRAVYASPNFGWFSYIVWLLELAFVTALTAAICEDLTVEPYCSRCRSWVTKRNRQYGPLENPEAAVNDSLFGNFRRLYALSRVSADRTRATTVTIESCQSTCFATTLISLAKRTSTPSMGEQKGSQQDLSLVSRLYVSARSAADLVEWVTATESIRPNLVPENMSELHLVVGAILPLVDDATGDFYAYGDIPSDVVTKARSKIAQLGKEPIAAIAVDDFTFIVNVYSAVVFTEKGLYVYGSANRIYYDDFRKELGGSDAAAIAALEKAGLNFKTKELLPIIRRIVERRDASSGDKPRSKK